MDVACSLRVRNLAETSNVSFPRSILLTRAASRLSYIAFLENDLTARQLDLIPRTWCCFVPAANNGSVRADDLMTVIASS